MYANNSIRKLVRLAQWAGNPYVVDSSPFSKHQFWMLMDFILFSIPSKMCQKT